LLTAFSVTASAQNWSSLLDASRAVDWRTAGFTIPSYANNCVVQPTLTSSPSAASANATSIQNALSSCDATHNVVNIPAGTWYVTFILIENSHVVIRGAGPNSTTIIPTVGRGCAGGITDGICLFDPNDINFESAEVLPPSGSQQCSWSAGYAQGTTTITLSNCGGAPPVGSTVILDQANDSGDTGGIYICDDLVANCALEGPGDNLGRFIGGAYHAQQQVTKMTGVTALGGGSYSVTLSSGVYFTNIRAGQNPGAFWFETLQNDGIENLTIDGATMSSGSPTDYGNMGMYQCSQCWVKNVRSQNAGRHHVAPDLSFQPVIRDSYFYGALGGHSQSYGVEMQTASGAVVENNIFQQTTAPIVVSGSTTGSAFTYNFSLNDYYTASPDYVGGLFFSHSAGNEMNLFEGNNFVVGPWGDDIHGSSDQVTLFRNMSPGWYTGKTEATQPFIARAKVRGMNIIGGVYGQPGYHTQYQSYATSSTGGVGGAQEGTVTIYSFGWPSAGDQGCSVGLVTNGCDPLSFSTAMRWGNYDVVTNGVRWDSTEASPSAVPYENANFSSAYFGSLAHALPASLYYASAPAWWPSGKNWPPIGPDVSSGNVGTCTGTYSGAQATSSSQCSGGTLSTAWANHVTSIPAQDCYLTKMGGPPDGSGSVLSFDARQCYASVTSGAPAPPTGLTATVL
jgi:hypothetical protein